LSLARTGVASRYPPCREIAPERGAQVPDATRRKDYTAPRYVGRHTYQARQAAEEGFELMSNYAITSALAGDELDCRAGPWRHLWNQRRRVSLSSRLL